MQTTLGTVPKEQRVLDTHAGVQMSKAATCV
jgi:hypothetical protein